MRAIPPDIGTIHFVGIGGIGMSGIAEVLHVLGYSVRGADLSENQNVLRLQEKGIDVVIGHDRANVEGASIVVVSSAVKEGNPELQAARESRIPVVKRAEMLAELMRLKWSIAIAGTHGKTTTTSMVGAMLEEGGFDPTVINGGIVNSYGSNTRLGSGEWMVVEADESDGSFTRLPASVAVITNIDPEHMDHYGDFEGVKSAFRQFVENLPFYGFGVLCSDHPEVQSLIPELSDKRIITYGFNPQADVRADNVRSDSSGSVFDVTFASRICGEKEEILRDVYLPMLGQHNVENSLVALTIGHEMGIPADVMKKALEKFSGVKRRFTRTGEVNGIVIIDDYGHHPVEIKAVLKAARQAVDDGGDNRIIAVVQPHRYTRLLDLFDEFCTCFNDADHVIVADVYPAGEAPLEGASKERLADGLRAFGHKHVDILDSSDNLAGMIAKIANTGDYVICLGAGDITAWANDLPKQLEEIFG